MLNLQMNKQWSEEQISVGEPERMSGLTSMQG